MLPRYTCRPKSSRLVSALGFFIFLASSIPAATPYATSLAPATHALEIPPNRGAAALWQSLKKLNTRASLVMITAHPDDEDGAALAYESRAVGARATLLTLNRGEGGANLMSSDFWDALGLVRTQELLQADRYYGVDQFFTRVCDYGFSKTLSESLSKWTRERVLGDVVRLIRLTRPLVVTSVFVGGPSDGHGNHQVAGQMAKDVFDAAGDPHQFPEQLKQGLRPWTPLKYYALVPFVRAGETPLSASVSIPEGAYDPLLGVSYEQLARAGLGFQKSQHGGPFIPRAGEHNAAYHRFASRVPVAEHEESFFDGIDVSLTGIASLAPASQRAELSATLGKIQAAAKAAAFAFSVERPEACAPSLAAGLKQTNALLQKIETGSLPEQARYDVLHELRIKQAQFNNALLESLGFSLRASVRPDKEPDPLLESFEGDPDTFRMATPGQQFAVRVSIDKASRAPLQLRRIYLDSVHPGDFSIAPAAKPPASEPLLANQLASRRFAVRVSENASFTKPYFARPSIEQPYYDLLDPSDFGLPLSPYPLNAWVELEYLGVTLKAGQVVQTVHRETGLGVVYEPLTVGPAISVQASPRAGIVPLASKSFPLTVTIHSNVEGPARGSSSVQLPSGWQSSPASAEFATSQPGEDRTLHFNVRPADLTGKSYPLTAVATYAGKTYRQGYVVTGYPGLRPYFLYSGSVSKMTGADVKVAPGLKVAYLTGSGDDVPAALAELGIQVSFLSSSDLAAGDLGRYDVILLGVRTYAARPELAAHNGRLLDYVKNGGVLIVQYNTPEFDHNFGPYPYQMGSEPEEVTDEASRVNILEPANPVFHWPNKITAADFGGWVEERGSKFLTTWDRRYSALLETRDAGQAPQKGGLLYARYGKGLYIYDAYAFYRQLPEGVPGAFRLFANLLSLPKNPERAR